MAGPLSERIRPQSQPAPVPAEGEPKKKKHKPKPRPPKPPIKRLLFFGGFDERGFHPTLNMRLVADKDGKIVGLQQTWRHRETDEPEWRAIEIIKQEEAGLQMKAQEGNQAGRLVVDSSSAFALECGHVANS